MDGPSRGDRRFVSLEWDRGHENLIAVVHAESSNGLVISEIYDLTELPGRRWIRADEVIDIEDLESDHPALRLARLRGSLANHTVAEPADLDSLLRKLQDTSRPTASGRRRRQRKVGHPLLDVLPTKVGDRPPGERRQDVQP